uniref:Uncharacterized protein n=1 Tax=Dunaliella tertiolecta TaxID=3047 RepID=A0A7S3QY80_DUNTE|mmetsp:Transcript_17203/g.47723  ORF Transcript_17203/g.47723 Transcript_17203/m.47723 type:complete len:279 (-) Transcript_17203:110-946(-)
MFIQVKHGMHKACTRNSSHFKKPQAAATEECRQEVVPTRGSRMIDTINLHANPAMAPIDCALKCKEPWHASQGAREANTIGATQVWAGPGSRVTHCTHQRPPPAACHLALDCTTQKKLLCHHKTCCASPQHCVCFTIGHTPRGHLSASQAPDQCSQLTRDGHTQRVPAIKILSLIRVQEARAAMQAPGTGTPIEWVQRSHTADLRVLEEHGLHGQPSAKAKEGELHNVSQQTCTLLGEGGRTLPPAPRTKTAYLNQEVPGTRSLVDQPTQHPSQASLS